MNIIQNISKVCDRLAVLISAREATEKDRIYASQIVDRVLEVVKSGGEKGCPASAFISKFKLDEADFVDHAIQILGLRGIIKKEVKYFIADNK